MRSRLWLAELMRTIQKQYPDLENLNQLGILFDDSKTGKMLYRYAKGSNGSSSEKVKEIDQWVKRKVPAYAGGLQSIFHIGPASQFGPLQFTPLWDALEAPVERLWEILVSYDPQIAAQKYLGVSFGLRSSYLLARVFGVFNPPPYWENARHANVVAEAYKRNEFVVDADLITVAIASWRMAKFFGDCTKMMSYILIGLLDQAIPDVLDQMCIIKLDKIGQQYGLSKDMFEHLKNIDLKYLAEAEGAIKDLNYDVQCYPTEDGYEQLLDFSHEMNEVKRFSVHDFLSGRYP